MRHILHTERRYKAWRGFLPATKRQNIGYKPSHKTELCASLNKEKRDVWRHIPQGISLAEVWNIPRYGTVQILDNPRHTGSSTAAVNGYHGVRTTKLAVHYFFSHKMLKRVFVFSPQWPTTLVRRSHDACPECEHPGRILLGDSTGGGSVMLRPIRFRCVGSLDFSWTTLYVHTHTYLLHGAESFLRS